MKASLSWVSKMQFHCENHGIKSTIDAKTEHGGEDHAANPKELLLNAMMGCTAMDVISILQKMRQEVSSFTMEITAEKNQDYPVYFKSVMLHYFLQGPIAPEKAIKAVDSSLTTYCGVNYMISKICRIQYQLHLNAQLIKEGEAHFIDPKN